MSKETIAIANPTHPLKVALWCDGVQELKDGRIKFDVINGAWRGYLDPEKQEVLVHETGKVLPGMIVWRGQVAKAAYPIDRHGGGWDYNSAIAWIEEQIANPPVSLDPVAEGYSEADFGDVERLA